MRDQFKVNVISIEYPGYGLLQGIEPNEETIFEVALTVFRYLVDELRVSYSSVIVFGRSLGSGPAIFLASQYPLGGMILVSPFISIRAAARHIGGRLVAFMFSNVFQNHRRIVNVSCPVLFIHGASDSLIPVEHSKTLFGVCRSRKLLVTPAKMDHNSSMFSDPNSFAVPAIHFFGFPGWRTLTPPFMPFDLFEAHKSDEPALREAAGKKGEGPESWLYNCCGKLSEEATLEAVDQGRASGHDEFCLTLTRELEMAPFWGSHLQNVTGLVSVWEVDTCMAIASDQVLVRQEKTLQEECVQNDYASTAFAEVLRAPLLPMALRAAADEDATLAELFKSLLKQFVAWMAHRPPTASLSSLRDALLEVGGKPI
ncbi:unnamed protein product [Durusdinium trenchii]|uniref:Serine hydrolase FSH domain-containing protein n=1 Tax=Durusdinium trenchii TaxID=1381693 RepID=A0ABP0PD25_9DINO